MKILHTSDWHLGRKLYEKRRYDEFSSFLDWLVKTIEKEKIDTLLIAGDIFDSSNPSNKAQQLYYDFLYRASLSCCRHVVITSGNHDSPSLLDAPKTLLQSMNIYVIGAAADNIEDEVIILYNGKTPEAIICAVPYLRDKDVRVVEADESIDDKNIKLIQGIKNHYDMVCSLARKRQQEYEDIIPIIAMGHLFAAGGKTADGDGVRELYVGSLAHVSGSIFPSFIDYLALGHLHIPQIVGDSEHIRYCGSPIAMGFNEGGHDKKVVMVEFNHHADPIIQEISIPCFQPLIRIAGSLDDIDADLKRLKQDGSSAWLEIAYTGRDMVTNLRELLDEALTGSAMEILRIKNNRIFDAVAIAAEEEETLDDLKPLDIFTRYLDAHDIAEDQRDGLIASHNEIIQSLQDDDKGARDENS